MTLAYGSVCSGIEAATTAWHSIGWQPQFFSEIEAAPRAVLKHRWPEVPLHGDFTTIREGEYGAIDLLVGGTPCQSFSVAGLRGGLADDRGNLALQYLRLAQRLRPRWLVWENVPGVLSSSGGRDFGAILGGMVELGYGFAYRVLDAQYVRVDGYGRAVPQRRRRVFVVGHLGDWRRPAAVLLERASLRGDPAPRREAGAGVAASLTSSLGRRCGAPDGGDTEGHLIAGTLGASHGNIRAEQAWTGQLVTHALRGEGFDASEDGTGRGTPIVPVAFGGGNTAGPIDVGTCLTNHASRSDFDTETFIAFSCKDHGADATDAGAAPTLRAMGHGESHANAGGQLAVAWSVTQDSTPLFERELSPSLKVGTGLAMGQPPCIAQGVTIHGTDPTVQKVASYDELAQCLRARTPGNIDNSSTTVVHHGWSVRRLTPTECERLQGFPDGHTLVPWRGGLMPDGPRYKMLGNSMACNVMRWIGRRIEAVEALDSSLMAAE